MGTNPRRSTWFLVSVCIVGFLSGNCEGWAGSIIRTGQPTDIAIDGPGHFVIRDGSEFRLTRSGRFRIESDGVGAADYTDPAPAGDWASQLVGPGQGGAGRIQVGNYELPNPVIQISRFDRTVNSFRPGPVVRTEIQSHLALDGPGFFEVYDPVCGHFNLTRCGAFKVDSQGYLVTLEHGLRVQGWTDAWSGEAGAYPRSIYGSIQIDVGTPPPSIFAVMDPNASFTAYSIDSEGLITVRLSDGVQYYRGQIRIVNVPDPSRLNPVGNHFYRMPPPSSGPAPFAETDIISTRLRSGSLDFNQLDDAMLDIWRRQLVGVQGAVMRVADQDMLAISGPGFFVLRDPDTGHVCATRLGIFRWTNDGYLESVGGWRVCGFRLAEFVIEDVRLNIPTGHTAIERSVDSEGKVHVRLEDGSTLAVAQICLMHANDVTDLREIEPYHYQLPPELGAPTAVPGFAMRPGTAELGRIQSGALESIWEVARNFPNSTAPRGIIVSGWGCRGRSAFIEWTDNVNAWRQPGMSINRQELPDPGYLVLPDSVAHSARFYRLVSSSD